MHRVSGSISAKYRRCSGVSDRVGGSYKRKIGQYDFVPWTYVQGDQSKVKCSRAIRHSKGIVNMAVPGKRGFKFVNIFPD